MTPRHGVLLVENEGPDLPEPPRTWWWLVVPGVLAIAGLAVLIAFWQRRPHLTDQDVDAAVFASIEQESKEAFLVTGNLDLNTEVTIDNTLRLLPGLLDLAIGTTSVTVRAPGRVAYGFDIAKLTPDRITLLKDGTIEVKVPQPVLYSVTPDLAKLEIATKVGWSRLGGNSATKVEGRALTMLQDNMRMQALQHMMDSRQPDVNSADALYGMMRPGLVAVGMREPKFRFLIGTNLVMEPRDR